jgi:hypothetical protein
MPNCSMPPPSLGIWFDNSMHALFLVLRSCSQNVQRCEHGATWPGRTGGQDEQAAVARRRDHLGGGAVGHALQLPVRAAKLHGDHQPPAAHVDHGVRLREAHQALRMRSDGKRGMGSCSGFSQDPEYRPPLDGLLRMSLTGASALARSCVVYGEAQAMMPAAAGLVPDSVACP